MQKAERLYLAYEHLKSLGIVHKQKDVADAMGGVSAPNISNAFKGNPRYLTDSFIKRFNKAFDNIFNEEWLIDGAGEMLSFERKIIKEAEPINPISVLYVPLVSQHAHAGYLNGYENDTYMENLPTIPYFPDADSTSENFIAFEVRGDSMDDNSKEALSEGDTIICREIPIVLWKDSPLPINRWDFVIVHEEGIIVKRITKHDVSNHTITIHSLNDFYPDKVVDLARVKQIFCIVETRKNRRRK